MTAALPIYDSSSNYGHYVTAKGYEFKAVGATGYDRVYYNDPNYKSEFYGEHYSTWSAMRTAINNNAGLYIMAS